MMPPLTAGDFLELAMCEEQPTKIKIDFANMVAEAISSIAGCVLVWSLFRIDASLICGIAWGIVFQNFLSRSGLWK
jgi:hypothetical protein